MKKKIILAGLFLFTKIQGIHLVQQTKDDSLIFDKNVSITGQLSPQFYAQAVAQLPIVCVDVFVLNEVKNEYFLVYRKNKPAQNSFCLPGGRLYKGETFLECAYRKCFEEAGLKIDPKRIIYTYSAIFPDSAWDCPTHTVSIVVFATCDSQNINSTLDHDHENSKWVSIYDPADNEYIEAIRKKSLEALNI